ncbi:MAG: acyltransferase family protein [Bacteroidaceae bacterium]|nr:acyltransferase family protein [Bacteroidaceae bacterium]
MSNFRERERDTASSRIIQNKIIPQKRSLNLELLRIVAMFMVLVIHYDLPIRGIPTVELWQSDSSNVSLTIVIQSLVEVCVNCFILISGYFGIRWKWKSFSNLIFQILFFMLVAYIASLFLRTEVTSPKGLFTFFLTQFTTIWFIIAYLGLYMIAPILEAYVGNVSERQLTIFLIVFYSFSTFMGYILKCSPEFNEGMSFVSLGGIYLIGGLLRKSKNNISKIKGWYAFAGYSFCAIMLTTMFAIELSMGFGHSPLGYLNPIVIIESVCLFVFFLKLQISDKWRRIILFFSSSAFSVFLFHVFLRNTYDELCTWAHNISNGSLLFVFVILIGVFILSVLVDKLRQVSFKALMKLF